VKLKSCRKRAVTSKATTGAEELAPEIAQVIALVAEIMLDQRRRRALDTQLRRSPESLQMIRRKTNHH
jgi:hypothetical protein